MTQYNSILQSIYYDPEHPASFSSAYNLYKAATLVDKTITLRNVKQWLMGEFTYTLHKPVRRKFIRNQVITDKIDGQWEADLADMQEFVKPNSGFKYILTIIDTFSKYAWAKPLKNKTSNMIIDAFKKIFEEGRKPENLRTDRGKEFVNNDFKKFLLENNIKHYLTKNKDVKCAIVERFNRTLKNKMFKYMTAKGTRRYIDILSKLVNSYNNRKHRTIKMKPSDVNLSNSNIVFTNIYGVPSMEELKKIRAKSTLQPKDIVRKQYDFKPFDKGYYPNWTDRLFEVEKIYRGPKKSVYTISDDTEQRYYPEQLQKVRQNLYRIEKVIKTRMRRNKKEFFVKWLGYSDEFNSWVGESELINL